MKRISFLLASLAAIVLLACSDNSNPFTEDVNNPQVPTKALQKISINDEIQGIDPGQSTINGSQTVSCGTMSVSGSGCSNWAICSFSAPTGAVNSSYQFIGGGPSGGTFGIDYAEIQCGNYLLSPFYPFSYANMSTTQFSGKPANVTCYIRFCGKCTGTPCNLSITNIKGTQYYQ